jgi:hypothetical protein
MERLGLLDTEPVTLHCTPPYTSALPAKSTPGSARKKDIWFRGMAQMFSTVSPAMFKEFELDYMAPLMAQCALTYYGCCEPLDNRIQLLKTIPNLRKIGVSPWANEEKSAEQIGPNYVYARKPNPAAISGTINETALRQEIQKTIDICKRHNCPYEFVLKDISTVGHNPDNLTQWVRIVEDVIDQNY